MPTLPEIERHQTSGPAPPAPVTISTDIHSPFSQSDLNHALSLWQSVLQKRHEEFERREVERQRRNGKVRTISRRSSDCDAKRL